MKKCPYCAEEILDEAIKCKHCGEMLNKKVTQKVEDVYKVKGKKYIFFGMLMMISGIAGCTAMVCFSPDINTGFCVSFGAVLFTIGFAVALIGRFYE